MNKSLIALLAAGLVSTVAQAQAPTWTGFNAGVTLGASSYTNTWTDTGYDWYGGSLSYTKRKVVPAIHVGWDTQVDSIVYGVELDHSFNTAKIDRIYSTSPGNPPQILKSDELKSVTTLRGRMGLTVGDSLFYATAGFAKAQADHSWVRPSNSSEDMATSNSHTGLVYGFGIEHRITPMISVRAEYLNVNIPEASATNANGYTMEIGDQVSTFAVGASFHF